MGLSLPIAKSRNKKAEGLTHLQLFELRRAKVRAGSRPWRPQTVPECAASTSGTWLQFNLHHVYIKIPQELVQIFK